MMKTTSRYESQKRRDWQTFTRYLHAHRPPLQLRRCSGAHVLEFLRSLDRSGKTRVHAPPCPAYGGGGRATKQQQPEPEEECRCPLRQAWGSLDALVGRLRAAYDERHGSRRRGGGGGGGGGGDDDASAGDAAAGIANPFAARAVRLYLRDVRDAQSAARGISYTRKKKKRKPSNDDQGSTTTTLKNDDDYTTLMATAASAELHTAAPYPPPPPLQPAYLNGVPLDQCCDFSSSSSSSSSSVLGGRRGSSSAGGGPAACYGTLYLPLLFNSFGHY